MTTVTAAAAIAVAVVVVVIVHCFLYTIVVPYRTILLDGFRWAIETHTRTRSSALRSHIYRKPSLCFTSIGVLIENVRSVDVWHFVFRLWKHRRRWRDPEIRSFIVVRSRLPFVVFFNSFVAFWNNRCSRINVLIGAMIIITSTSITIKSNMSV